MLWLGPEKYFKMIDFFKLFLIFESFLILSIVPKFYLNAIKSLTFITALELMYKSAIIVGMLILFYFQRSADSLIWGQIIALMIFMPIEYFLVNRKLLKENMLRETLLTILPSLMIMAAILSSQLLWILAFSILGISFYIFTFIKDKNFDFKLLKE